METTINAPTPDGVSGELKGRMGKPGASFGRLALLLLPIGYLWFRLINNLRLEWSTNPQYSFGLVVPLLMVGLLLRRWHRSAGGWPEEPAARPELAFCLFAGLAFLYLPTRLVEGATPEWRPIQWMLAFEAIGLTLAGIYLLKGKCWLRQVLFPIAFFLVAVPWPTVIEQPIIQGLTRFNAGMVVNVLGLLDVPAIQHGNVIEVSTGMVGINDACSGIRSLQSSLMISLFFGEYYFLRWPFRLLFVGLGFGLAMAFNLCRASLLAWIAAKQGVAAIGQYHDEAGFLILVACTLTLWGVGYLFSRHTCRRMPEGAAPPAETGGKVGEMLGTLAVRQIAVGLIVWLVVVEAGVALWYHVREAGIKPGPAWTVTLPESNPSFATVPITPDENVLLRFDGAKQGRWQEDDGSKWQLFYFDWLPGRVAGYLAKRHTPDICMPATGLKIVSGPTAAGLTVHGVYLPMRSYVFESDDQKLQVYQCRWEPGVTSAYAGESGRFNLIRGVWAGRGNQGQKVLEVIISGYDNPDAAHQALVNELDKLIKVDEPTAIQHSTADL